MSGNTIEIECLNLVVRLNEPKRFTEYMLLFHKMDSSSKLIGICKVSTKQILYEVCVYYREESNIKISNENIENYENERLNLYYSFIERSTVLVISVTVHSCSQIIDVCYW